MFYTYMLGRAEQGLVLVSGLSGLFIVFLCFLLYFSAYFSLWHMGILFFLTMFMSYLLRFWDSSGVGLALSWAFHGGEQLGFIVGYCMIWGMLKEHVGFRSFKIILVVTLTSFFLVYASLGKLVSMGVSYLPLISCLVTFIFFIGFLMLSPSYLKFFGGTHKPKEKDAQASEEKPEVKLDIDNITEESCSAISDKMDALCMTRREKQICCLILQGLSTMEISGDLGVSVNTAKFHIKNIYKKTNVTDRGELFSVFSDYNVE